VITTKPAELLVKVTFKGELIADSGDAVALKEGSYPVVYYLPRKDVKMDRLARSSHTTHCPFKGDASYFSLAGGPENAVWSYETPYDEMPEWGALGPKSLKGSPVTIHLYVDDVDAVVERAVKAGAKVTMPVADQFWGDRYGKLEDPFGHHWSVATHVRDVSMEEAQKAMREMEKSCTK